MAVLRPCPMNANRFSWNGNHGFVEASDLGGYHPGQVYDDACDEGFTLYNPKTGGEVVFCLEKQDIKDGELRAWDFVSINTKTGRPDGKFTAAIFND